MAARPRKTRDGTTGRKKVQGARRRVAKNKDSAARPGPTKKRAQKNQEKNRASLSDLIKVMIEVRGAVIELRNFFVREDITRASRATAEAINREPEPASLPDIAITQQTNEPHDESRTDGNSDCEEHQIENTHTQLRNEGIAKHKYKPLVILECCYRKAQEAINTGQAEPVFPPSEILKLFHSTTRGDSDAAPQESFSEAIPDSGHVIGKLLRQLSIKHCLVPAHDAIEITEKMRQRRRNRSPVRAWKLTDIGKRVVEHELELRRQASVDDPTT